MDDRLVQIGKFGLPAEAHLAKSLLENEGIAAHVESQEGDSLLGLALSGTGGVALYVRAEDANRAAVLLAEAQSGGRDPEDEDPFRAGRLWLCRVCDTPVDADRGRCPECDSPRTDIQVDTSRWTRPGQADERPQPRVETIQAQAPPPAPEAPPEATPQERDPDLTLTVSPGDRLVYRAFRYTAFGFLFTPFIIAGVYCLLRAMFDKRVPQPSDKAVPWFWATVGLQVLWVLLFIAICAGLR